MTTTNCTLLHNPRCSKSRATLALLESRGVNVTPRLYLSEPLDKNELLTLMGQLQLPHTALLRAREAKAAGFDQSTDTISAKTLADWLAGHPECLQRPVAIIDSRAIIGRPPEQVLALLDPNGR